MDCSACQHFQGPVRWPDKHGISSCLRHGVSLAIQLGADGRRQGTWFCKEFNGGELKSRPATAHIEKLRANLEPGKLYALHGNNRYLIEHKIADLEKAKPGMAKCENHLQ